MNEREQYKSEETFYVDQGTQVSYKIKMSTNPG